MKKAGQPTKYNETVKRLLLLLAQEGLTDKKMAKIIDVKEQTLNNWKKAHPKFFESLKKAKKVADESVERSLYERACGYEHPDVHISNYQGEVTITDVIKHYPPDPTSMIFWLKNRQPDKWQDRKAVEHSGNIGLGAMKDSDLDAEIKRLEKEA